MSIFLIINLFFNLIHLYLKVKIIIAKKLTLQDEAFNEIMLSLMKIHALHKDLP